MNELLAQINKEFGVGTLVPATDIVPRTYRGSGSIALDVALGGGYGKSTVVDVIGKQSAGKTLLFEMAAVEAQKVENLSSVLFDFEATFDPRRFNLLGGDLGGLYLVRAENFASSYLFIEWATDMLKTLLASKTLACIGLDSTAAMISKAEFTIKEAKGEEASTMAYTARGIASLLRQIIGTGLVARSGATLFFMSQMRDNIGARGFRGQPPPDKRTGGRALPFFASTQLEVSRGEAIKAELTNDHGVAEGDVAIGGEVKVKVRKNKNNAKQGRVCAFDLYQEGELLGVDRIGELAKLAVLTGVCKRSGSWIDLPNDEGHDGGRVQGMAALKERLRNDESLLQFTSELTRAMLEVVLTENADPSPSVVYGDEDPDERIMAGMS